MPPTQPSAATVANRSLRSLLPLAIVGMVVLLASAVWLASRTGARKPPGSPAEALPPIGQFTRESAGLTPGTSATVLAGPATGQPNEPPASRQGGQATAGPKPPPPPPPPPPPAPSLQITRTSECGFNAEVHLKVIVVNGIASSGGVTWNDGRVVMISPLTMSDGGRQLDGDWSGQGSVDWKVSVTLTGGAKLTESGHVPSPC